MRALVIGQGGREHALVRALRLSPSIEQVYAAPGSEGMSRDEIAGPHVAPVKSLALDWRNTAAVVDLVTSEKIDFVMIGPEVPLVEGCSDALRSRGIAVVGPSRQAAMLEGSKVFSKEFMVAAGVPTARSQVVTSVEEAKSAAAIYAPPYVLKADGLAAGKGVFICKTMRDLEEAAQSLFVDRSLGDAGHAALVEEFQPGYEISYLILTNGSEFEPLVLAQDHKRLRDGDEGPNTGGMGVIAPVEIDADLRSMINTKIVYPTLREMQKRGLLYRGVLYIGLMVTPAGPSVIEYNARFGDPETQVILPLLKGDWGVVLSELAHGRLEKLEWSNGASACVVLAAEGYPDHPVKGVPLSIAPGDASANRYFLHAGTQMSADGQWVTGGGRVLNAIGLGTSRAEALKNAYAQAEKAKWPGLQFRRDIGAKLP